MQGQNAKTDELATRIDEAETWSAEADVCHSTNVTRFAETRQVKTSWNREPGVIIFVFKVHRHTDSTCAKSPVSETKPSPLAPEVYSGHFQQYSIKEMVIKKAWQQKITIGGKPLYFDHDYTVTVLQQG